MPSPLLPVEQALLTCLLQLDAAAAAIRAGGPKPDLRPILDQLRQQTDTLPANAHPDLRHYLQRQSYEKARLFLQDRAAEVTPGTCGD